MAVAEAKRIYSRSYFATLKEGWICPGVSGVVGGIEMIPFEDSLMQKLGGVTIITGSDSDEKHIDKIAASLMKWDIPFDVRICSAHKQPHGIMEIIEQDQDEYFQLPRAFVTVAGGTDALSGLVAFHSLAPVVSSPPDGYNPTCLTNPPTSSNGVFYHIDNLARFFAQAFSATNPWLRAMLLKEAKDADKFKNSVSGIYLTQAEQTGAVFVLYPDDSAKGQVDKIMEALVKYQMPFMDIPFERADHGSGFCFTHESLQAFVHEINRYTGNFAFIIVDKKGGNIAENFAQRSVYPVISCPDFSVSDLAAEGINTACYVKRPGNAARFAAQLFSASNPKVQRALFSEMRDKTDMLNKKDAEFRQKYAEMQRR
jgi:phosphoribosylcarboxyaminoimidazole (NCAIR) mutase